MINDTTLQETTLHETPRTSRHSARNMTNEGKTDEGHDR